MEKIELTKILSIKAEIQFSIEIEENSADWWPFLIVLKCSKGKLNIEVG